MTEDVVAFFNDRLGQNLTPIFDQYLRHAALPTLELAFDLKGTVSLRWQADAPGFAMPIRVGIPGQWTVVTPTAAWQMMPTNIGRADFSVATDMYYVNVSRRDRQ
jgi:hypothetical protein